MAATPIGQKLKTAAAVASVGVNPGTRASAGLNPGHARRQLKTLAEALPGSSGSVRSIKVELALNFAPERIG